MIQIVCAVFDRASQLYGRPLFVAAVGQAVRSFTDEVNRSGADASEIAKHPDDFDLWQLARFDDSKGEFVTDSRVLARGKDVVIRNVQE